MITTRLFTLDDDPWETENLADRADAAERVEEMTRLLREWITKSGDTIDLDQPGWGFPSLR